MTNFEKYYLDDFAEALRDNFQCDECPIKVFCARQSTIFCKDVWKLYLMSTTSTVDNVDTNIKAKL